MPPRSRRTARGAAAPRPPPRRVRPAQAVRHRLSRGPAWFPLLSEVVPVFNEEQTLRSARAQAIEAGDLEAGEAPVRGRRIHDRSAELIDDWVASETRRARAALAQLRHGGGHVGGARRRPRRMGGAARRRSAGSARADPQMLERAASEAPTWSTPAHRRDAGALKRGLATAFYRLMARLARVPDQGQAGDFRLMSRRVVETVREMPERRRFVRGKVAWTGYEQVPIDYHERAGRTGAVRPTRRSSGSGRRRSRRTRTCRCRSPRCSGRSTAALSAVAAVS